MLSIIIPALNEELWLPCLLESIRNQNYEDYEIIVADAGSSDSSKSIARRYGCRLTKGGLPGVGRNNGAKIAGGDYLLFLDADVVLPEKFLSEIMHEFIENGIDVATCFIQPLTERKIDFALHKIINYYMRITQKIYPHAPGFCILSKKIIHEKIKGFNRELKLAEDHDYVKRAAKIGRFKILSSQKIPVSVRRLDKDGRFNLSIKYSLAELHRIIKGEITSEIFNYKFGYYIQEKNRILMENKIMR